MLTLNCLPQGAVKGSVNLLYNYSAIYIKRVTSRKLVSFAILAALFLYNNLISIQEAIFF